MRYYAMSELCGITGSAVFPQLLIAFVPYSSLGKTNGIIRVIEADKLEIVRGTHTYPIYHQKLGLTAQKLSSSGKWKMLLHREIKEAV